MNTRLTSVLARLALLAYGLAAALAALVLWGWALDLPPLRDFGARFSAMPPAAALGTLLLAAGCLAVARGRRRAAYASAAAAALIAVLSLAGVGVGFGLAEAGLMSPAAALAMLLLALA